MMIYYGVMDQPWRTGSYPVVVLDTRMHWRPCLEVYLNDQTNRVCLGIIINQYSIQHDDNLITLSSIPGKLFLIKRRRAGTL